MLLGIKEWIERSMSTHPWKWGFASFIIIWLPQWLSGTWALWSEEPLAKAVSRGFGMSALTLSSFWITIPISLAMFGYLAYVLRKPKPLAPLSPDYISLRDAAATLYGECRARKSKWIIGAEALSGHGISRGNHEDILDWMAGIIEVKKPIYGMRLPSNIREKISKDDINHAVFTKGATQLEHFLPGKGILYTNLEMKASDLDDLIQEMSFEAVDQE